MPKEKKGAWQEKTLNLRISAEEHRAIKLLATEEGMTIKQFIYDAIEKVYPHWRERSKSK